MKAEHSKVASPNRLGDQVGKVLHSIKVKPSSTVTIVVGFIVLAAGLFIAWHFIRAASEKSRSAQWLRLEQAEGMDDLDKLIKDNPNTRPGQVAKLKKARVLMAEGLPFLYTFSGPDGGAANRKEARDKVKQAGELYEKLIDEFKEVPALNQETLLMTASAKQASGDFDAAAKHFNDLVNRYPASSAGKKAEEALKGLDAAKKLQAILDAQFAERPSTPPLPPVLPPSGDGTGTPSKPVTPELPPP